MLMQEGADRVIHSAVLASQMAMLGCPPLPPASSLPSGLHDRQVTLITDNQGDKGNAGAMRKRRENNTGENGTRPMSVGIRHKDRTVWLIIATCWPSDHTTLHYTKIYSTLDNTTLRARCFCDQLRKAAGP